MHAVFIAREVTAVSLSTLLVITKKCRVLIFHYRALPLVLTNWDRSVYLAQPSPSWKSC